MSEESLTCIPCKLLEHIVCSNIVGIVVKRTDYSIKWLGKNLGQKGQVDTFILDFEKAFDSLPHERTV